MQDVIQYTHLARHHLQQFFDKRAGWVPLLYSLLALSALLLIAKESQVVRTNTQPDFFYNLHDLQQEHRASCANQRHRLNTSFYSPKTPPLPLCASISQGSLTASSLWKAHYDTLVTGSKHPLDRAGRHQAWQRALLDLVSPNLLQHALVNSPSHDDLQRIINIIDRRRAAMYQKFHLKLKHVDMPPMLQVVVFGGSVPEGTGCADLPSEIYDYLPNYYKRDKDDQIQGKDCTWPYRLQLLADAFFGKWVVHVHNLAIGGTNSRLTIPTLEYQLYQEQALVDAGGADVIINGYAVNDNLKEDANMASNTTGSNKHYDDNLDKAQEFVSKALASRPCSENRPVVLFFDDAYGNHNADVVLGDTIRADAIRMVTDVNNLMFISAVAPVKQLVEANEPETVFSPTWWRSQGRRITNGHYQMPGHQYAAYAIAYAMLQSLVDYCVAEEFHAGATLTDKALLPPVPKVDGNSKLSTITELWKDKSDLKLLQEKEYCASANAKAKPCLFAFISNPAGTVRNAKEINNYVNSFIKNARSDNTVRVTMSMRR